MFLHIEEHHYVGKHSLFFISDWIRYLISNVGVYKYSDKDFANFADIFIPFYLIVFGVLLICAEAEWIIMIKHFKFLDNYFGR